MLHLVAPLAALLTGAAPNAAPDKVTFQHFDPKQADTAVDPAPTSTRKRATPG